MCSLMGSKVVDICDLVDSSQIWWNAGIALFIVGSGPISLCNHDFIVSASTVAYPCFFNVSRNFSKPRSRAMMLTDGVADIDEEDEFCWWSQLLEVAHMEGVPDEGWDETTSVDARGQDHMASASALAADLIGNVADTSTMTSVNVWSIFYLQGVKKGIRLFDKYITMKGSMWFHIIKKRKFHPDFPAPHISNVIISSSLATLTLFTINWNLLEDDVSFHDNENCK